MDAHKAFQCSLPDYHNILHPALFAAGCQGSAVLDEPVREEDSFSKESMSQESEISENILLPDLAKQSESIEQQSGEIAERGMPT